MMWTPIFGWWNKWCRSSWGYRNYNTNDDSTNMSPIGVIIGGEELHNNHRLPNSTKFSLKPWEFDIGWMYIKVFGFFGLCKVKRLAPKLSYKTNKTLTLSLLHNQYYNQVKL